ncbi:hypothetical protein D9M71_511000 [compost metagenome]
MGGIGGGLEFDLHPFGHQLLAGQARQLREPAGQQRIDHEAVVGVIGADRVEAQPGASAVGMEARMATVVGGVQRLEAQQGARCFADSGRLGRSDAGQACLAEAADATHVQTQGRVSGQFDGGMAQVHVTRDG